MRISVITLCVVTDINIYWGEFLNISIFSPIFFCIYACQWGEFCKIREIPHCFQLFSCIEWLKFLISTFFIQIASCTGAAPE